MTKKHGYRKDFFPGGKQWTFPGMAKKIFPRGLSPCFSSDVHDNKHEHLILVIPSRSLTKEKFGKSGCSAVSV